MIHVYKGFSQFLRCLLELELVNNKADKLMNNNKMVLVIFIIGYYLIKDYVMEIPTYVHVIVVFPL